MKNIINAIEKEEKQHLENFIKEIKKSKDGKLTMSLWHIRDLVPKGKDITILDLKEQKAYLIGRKEKKVYKSIEGKVKEIKDIMASGQFTGAKISVEWKKSRMWGSNPTAECWATFINKNGNTDSVYIKSSSIGGCGYDKLSTAVAECLNQIKPLLKLLYVRKDKEIRSYNRNNRELFGYGSGYGILPRFEGGVGVSCYPAIFEKIGFNFKSVASGKTFDVFEITKI